MASRTNTLLSGLLTVLVVGSVLAIVPVSGSMQAAGEADARANSGGTVWQGQTVLVSSNENASGESWEIRQVTSDGEIGSSVTEFTLNQAGNATISTNGLQGQYVVVDADGDPVVLSNGIAQGTGSADEASWEVAIQTINATFAQEQISNQGNESSQTDLELTSNRDGYQVVLFSDNLSAQQLADVFSAAEVRNGQAVVQRNISSDDALDTNFTGVGPGTYEVTAVAQDTSASASASIVISEAEPGTATFTNGTVVEQQGDVARFTVQFDETDRATVTVGSPDVNYETTFTIVDQDGDGQATVRINTFLVGQSSDSGNEAIRAVGDDEITEYTMTTEPLNTPLDAAEYDLQLSVAGQITDVGALVLNAPSTEGMQIWTAPDKASPANAESLLQVVTQTDEIAQQDWAVVEIQSSGLSGYVQNLSDLNNQTIGTNFTLTQNPGPNQPVRTVNVSRAQLLSDQGNDSLFVLIDTNGLEVDSEYTANFTINDSNPYVEEGENESANATFTVVERTISIDNVTDGRLQLPASSDATISGTTSAAPGTNINVQVRARGAGAFVNSSQATVTQDGAWNATFDLSDVRNGTEFVVETDDPNANVSGVIVEEGPATEETTADNETATPTDEETTPANDTEAADETETVNETEAADETEAVNETATDGGEETEAADITNALTAGNSDIGIALGLVMLLLAGAFIILNER